MTYLKHRCARRTLLFFLTSAFLLSWFPALDLRVSNLFHRDGGFDLARSWWATSLHHSVGWCIGIALATVVGMYAFNRISGRNVGRADGMTVSYLLLVLALGAGLIVNQVLKNGFGRARPRNVIEFGGNQRFSPAFEISGECPTNGSFSSGDSSGAFFFLALALALGRRPMAFAIAATYGTLVSLARIASGAHFLSDTVVSFFVMWITADVLYYYLLLPGQRTARAREPAVQQAHVVPDRAAWGVSTASRWFRSSAAGASSETR